MRLHHFIFLVFLLAMNSAIAAVPTEFSLQLVNMGGVWRSYYVYVPSTPPEGGAPVVILLHGHGDTAANLIDQSAFTARPYSKWLPIAIAEQFVLLVPQGSIGPDEERGWNDCRADATENPTADDVSFLIALLDEVEEDVDINRNKVFVTGTSNGGHMALRMAIERPNDVTAVAPVVAAMPADSECAAPTVAVSIAFMNGTSDPILPYTGGTMPANRGSVLSTANSVAAWNTLHGITGSPSSSSFSNTDTSDGSTVDLDQYFVSSIPKVVLFRVNSGGHTEPSDVERYGPAVIGALGAQNGDIEMADQIWSFFEVQ